MDSQTVTLTLPFTAQQFWVFTIALSLIALSAGIVYVAGKRVEKERLPKDWLRDSLMIAGGLLAPIWAALLFMVLFGLWRMAWDMPPPSPDSGAELRWHMLSIVGLITSLFGILGAPLAMIRVVMTERQTRATEEGLITDRINKAVEGLGAVREVKDGEANSTEPNLEVRLGAVLSLARIADDSPRDRRAIVCIFSSYILENARSVSAAKYNKSHDRIRMDLQHAIHSASMITRKLTPKNISATDTLFDLRLLELTNTLIPDVDIAHAALRGAHLNNTLFINCSISSCFIHPENMENGGFVNCSIEDTYFEKIDFSKMHSFDRNSLQGCAFRKSDLSTEMASADILHNAFGDASVILPNGIDPDHDDWPSHWSHETLSEEEFNTLWRAWQRTIGFQPDENQQ